MGFYSEYLDNIKNFQSIIDERKKQIQKISRLRRRDVLTIASDMSGRPEKRNAPIGIDYTDLIAISDQISNLSGNMIDVILETPGGFAERAEDIVRMIRNKFQNVAFIVPGAAMSARTIMVMSGDEILMEPNSSLGPIDAQVFMAGKSFSAEAFLTGLEKIKKEVIDTGNLNRAYIPILQGISPGEIQSCQNAQDFSKTLVTKWLFKWKFGKWNTHSSTGSIVTDEEKKIRANEIAEYLCKHSEWLTHNRSIKLDDLLNMGLKITDYSKNPDLYDAISRYYTLIRMGFESTSMYKLFETPQTQISRFLSIPGTHPGLSEKGNIVSIEFQCPQCSKKNHIQVNFDKKIALKDEYLPFPKNNQFKCPHCGFVSDLGDIRKQIEAQSKKSIIT